MCSVLTASLLSANKRAAHDVGRQIETNPEARLRLRVLLFLMAICLPAYSRGNEQKKYYWAVGDADGLTAVGGTDGLTAVGDAGVV